jgi:hypothetical protein
LTVRAPVTRHVNRIVVGLRRVARSGEKRLTFDRLVTTLGAQSHRLLILMLTLLNMIPGPPGFGGTIAWIMALVALAMVLGRPIRLPGILGRRKLPLPALVKASEQVARVTAIIARFSKPRLRWLTGERTALPYGIFTIVVGICMTVPVPLINAVPNVGMCILAFGMLNRDGVAVIIGAVVALVGLCIEAALIWGAFHLGMNAVGAMGQG